MEKEILKKTSSLLNKEIKFKDVDYLVKLTRNEPINIFSVVKNNLELEISKLTDFSFWSLSFDLESLIKQDKKWNIFSTIDKVGKFITKEIEQSHYEFRLAETNLEIIFYFTITFGGEEEKSELKVILLKQNSLIIEKFEKFSVFSKELSNSIEKINETMNGAISKLSDYKLNSGPSFKDFSKMETNFVEDIDRNLNEMKILINKWDYKIPVGFTFSRKDLDACYLLTSDAKTLEMIILENSSNNHLLSATTMSYPNILKNESSSQNDGKWNSFTYKNNQQVFSEENVSNSKNPQGRNTTSNSSRIAKPKSPPSHTKIPDKINGGSFLEYLQNNKKEDLFKNSDSLQINKVYPQSHKIRTAESLQDKGVFSFTIKIENTKLGDIKMGICWDVGFGANIFLYSLNNGTYISSNGLVTKAIDNFCVQSGDQVTLELNTINKTTTLILSSVPQGRPMIFPYISDNPIYPIFELTTPGDKITLL
jgi:hypothetical protein